MTMADARAGVSPMVEHDLPFATVEQVVRALYRMGYACPEGKEEQAARANELVLSLCREVIGYQWSPPQAAGGEPVAWRHRYLCPKEGPSVWNVSQDEPWMRQLMARNDYEVRRLYDHPPAVGQECLQALRAYEQADHDGVMVRVSRQALDEVIAALSGAQPAGGGAG